MYKCICIYVYVYIGKRVINYQVEDIHKLLVLNIDT